jgi:hypothetical protein
MIDDIVREQRGLPKADATNASPVSDTTTQVDVTVSEQSATTTEVPTTNATIVPTSEAASAPASENTDGAQGVAATGEPIVLAEPVVIPDGASEGMAFPGWAEPAFDTAFNTEAENVQVETVVELTDEQRQVQFNLAVRSLFKYLTGVFPSQFSDVSTFAQIPDQESPSK